MNNLSLANEIVMELHPDLYGNPNITAIQAIALLERRQQILAVLNRYQPEKK